MNLYDRVFKHLLKGIETSLKRNKELQTYMEESFDKQGEELRELEDSFEFLKEGTWGLKEHELHQLIDDRSLEVLNSNVDNDFDDRLSNGLDQVFDERFDERFDELFDKRLSDRATTEEFNDYCLNNELKDAQDRLYSEQQELIEEQKNLCSRIEQLSNKVDGTPSTGEQLDACALEELVINTLIKYGVKLDVEGGE